MKKVLILLCHIIAFLGFTFCASSYACTSFILKAKDGSPIYGRSMEWGLSDFKSNLVLVPRGFTNITSLSGGKAGMKWKNKYGFVGINAFNLPFYMDGMNEAGLTVGSLFLPNLAEFQSFKSGAEASTINSAQLVGYLLGQFSSVAEIKARLPKIRVIDNPDITKAFGAPITVHFVVTDNMANSIVIEYVAGNLNIYDNQVGIMTNSPTYDWHLKNLRNYAHLSPYGSLPGSATTVDGINFSPFGAGSGMIGLPGDYTPPSRFVRAFFFTHNSLVSENAATAVDQAHHILNNFDIPSGTVREGIPAKYFIEYTQWSVIGDLKNKRYYWWTEWNQQIRMVDLTKLDFSESKAIATPLDKIRINNIEDRTQDFGRASSK
ncbi:MAG: choloylglycine hydrolase family protein [Gammaproteobacteria bacterium]|nr:choloylglycine hydrolase family protein [Gammaproteobacteria bacterium]